jgi:hypothetical protein
MIGECGWGMWLGNVVGECGWGMWLGNVVGECNKIIS